MSAPDDAGVPFRLLQEFKKQRIGVETSAGDSFRGVLLDCEENLALMLSGVKATFVDGNTAELESVYVKGSQVRLINFPDSAKKSLDKLSAERRRPVKGWSLPERR